MPAIVLLGTVGGADGDICAAPIIKIWCLEYVGGWGAVQILLKLVGGNLAISEKMGGKLDICRRYICTPSITLMTCFLMTYILYRGHTCAYD